MEPAPRIGLPPIEVGHDGSSPEPVRLAEDRAEERHGRRIVRKRAEHPASKQDVHARVEISVGPYLHGPDILDTFVYNRI